MISGKNPASSARQLAPTPTALTTPQASFQQSTKRAWQAPLKHSPSSSPHHPNANLRTIRNAKHVSSQPPSTQTSFHYSKHTPSHPHIFCLFSLSSLLIWRLYSTNINNWEGNKLEVLSEIYSQPLLTCTHWG